MTSENNYPPEKTQQSNKRSVSKQIILGLLTNFSNIAPSMSLGFSAIALPALTDIKNPHHLDANQASWFASVASLATPFGCLFSGPIADRFGRRSAMISINIICFIGWLLLASAYYFPSQQYAILIVARMLTGLSTGLSSIPATIYMAENSEPKLRSLLCTWGSVAFSLGVVIVYILGLIIKDDWGMIALLTAAFPCVGMVFVVFLIPESPSWLIAKNRLDEAKVNMCKIFGSKDVTPEILTEIDNLIRNRGVKNDNSPQKSLWQQCVRKLHQMTKPTCRKPFILMLIFFFFQQFSGTFVIVFYAINIVEKAGVTIDPYLTIVMIALVRLLTTMLMSYISKLVGRRPLGLISGGGMTICMLGLATYILLIDQGTIDDTLKSSLSALPVILLAVYFFTGALGFLPLPFAMSAEVFPRKVRGTATGLTSCMCYLFNFITVKAYVSMEESMGSQGLFFFYGAMSFAGTLFVLFFLPETKGKTLDEIEEYFGKKMEREVKRISLLKNQESTINNA